MTASYNFDAFADATGYWFTKALVTSAKLGQQAINEKTIMDYLQNVTVAGGMKEFNFLGGTATSEYKEVFFNADNQLAPLLGTGHPNFATAPPLILVKILDPIVGFDQYFYSLGVSYNPAYPITSSSFWLEWHFRGGHTHAARIDKVAWVAMGPGSMS